MEACSSEDTAFLHGAPFHSCRDESVLGKRPPRSSRELRLVVLAVLLATAAVALLAAVTLLAAYSEYTVHDAAAGQGQGHVPVVVGRVSARLE